MLMSALFLLMVVCLPKLAIPSCIYASAVVSFPCLLIVAIASSTLASNPPISPSSWHFPPACSFIYLSYLSRVICRMFYCYAV